jgi:hypothetical protein
MVSIDDAARASARAERHARAANRHPHILNAASNLLGICFVIIGALKLADANARSYADETAWASAAMFLASIVTSYCAIRSGDRIEWLTIAADAAFFAAIFLLAVAMAVGAVML